MSTGSKVEKSLIININSFIIFYGIQESNMESNRIEFSQSDIGFTSPNLKYVLGPADIFHFLTIGPYD